MINFDKFITFLNAIENGIEIEIGDRVYGSGLDSVDDLRIAHKVKVIKTNTNEQSYEFMQGLDLVEINDFIIYISKNMSDKQQEEIKKILNKTNDET